MPSTRSERENYNCIMEIMNVAVCEGLREIFKQEWDKHYGATKGVWDDTCISGNELHNMEKSRRHAKPYLNSYQCGKRSEWDCSALSDAILYSNAIKKHLAPHVSNEVDELREVRNKLTHKFGSQHKMSDVDFDHAYKKVKNCFKVLKLSKADVERIRNYSKGNHLTRFRETTYICLTIFIIGLICSVSYYWFTNSMETKLLFRVVPTRPVHLVANRSRTVNAILEELHNLSIRNNRSLTYLYISGNPGSGKSQLARLIGQRYGTNISYGRFGSTSFVMTLKGRSLHDILESYVDFARRVDCSESIIANTMNSNQIAIGTKIKSLKIEIAKILKNFNTKYTWLLIVDNVVKLGKIFSFLPQLEDEDWQGGQVLITTQDKSSVPSNSSLTVHISVSQGMDPAESCEFLTDLSGLVESQNLVSKVAKELDYQPLALASAAFYVKILRESKASSQFTWRDYLRKLDEGKRNLTEMKLSEVNEPAYSLTMSTAVLFAVTTFAESHSVLKHAFTFLSYVSHEVQSLQVVVSYVLRVDKENDKEDVGLRILQCALVLPSDHQKVVSVSLHRVVHDSIKLYIAHDTTKENTKSRVPLHVFQLLLGIQKCGVVGEISLIPHLKAFHARIKNFPSEIFVPGSMKIKQEMQEQIFCLTAALIGYGEFLLSKHFLILALKVATNRRDTDKIDLEGISYISFPKIGEIFFCLGVAESSFGNIRKYKEYLESALKIFLKQHGRSHEYVARCYLGLASLACSNAEECNEGIKYSKLALEIDDRLEFKGLYYEYQGRQQYFQGNLQEAKMYYFEAHQTLFRAIEANKSNIVLYATHQAQILRNLGFIDYDLGKYKDSTEFFRMSINLYLSINGQNHLGLAYSYDNLGLAHSELNELPEAEDCFRRSLEIYSQQLEPSHEWICWVSRELVAILKKIGQLNEAAYFYKQYGACRIQDHDYRIGAVQAL